MMKRIPALFFLFLLLTACEGVDCTLNNVVLCRYGFYDSTTGKSIQLSDTLTITAAGTDSILYNRGVNTSRVTLPMSYWQEADTLTLHISGKDYTYTNTLRIQKNNTQHFESPDCPTTMFHHIEKATLMSGVTIDSVVVVKPTVNYEQDENIKIYFRTLAE